MCILGVLIIMTTLSLCYCTSSAYGANSRNFGSKCLYKMVSQCRGSLFTSKIALFSLVPTVVLSLRPF